jgi:hypothetical protein
MNKLKNLLIILALCVLNSYELSAQIKLPKGFKCVGGINNINESHFEDGDLAFFSHTWGHEGLDPDEVPEAIRVNYNIKLKKTKDGLLWGTGIGESGYKFYIVVNGLSQYTLSAKGNNARFSNLSIWLLQQIRYNIAKNNDLNYTEYRGRTCYEFKK